MNDLTAPGPRIAVALSALLGLLALLAACTSGAPPTVAGSASPATSTGPGMPGATMLGNDDGAPRQGMPQGMSGITTGTVPGSPARTTGPIAGEEMDAVQVASLQAAVDGGHMPWRADPVAVAEMFAVARLGLPVAWAVPTGPTAVEVDGSDGHAASLQLVQPARTGSGGVWLVTGGAWVR